MNPVGLLACGSSERNCLPSAFAPVARMFRSSPLTVAGPRRIYTGFPSYTESYVLYGSFVNSVKHRRPDATKHFPRRPAADARKGPSLVPAAIVISSNLPASSARYYMPPAGIAPSVPGKEALAVRRTPHENQS